MAFSVLLFKIFVTGLAIFIHLGNGDIPLLPLDEVQILQTISTKLHNKLWIVQQASCGLGNWNKTLVKEKILTSVSCDCTFNNNTVCHVTNIKMKGLNLTGVVPPEFGNLSHLVEIDLTRNYLNGTIPGRLAELHNLRNLSLLGNRLSGSIPDEIGNINTLVELNLEDNLLGGPLPQNLGNLRQLKRLLLSGNNFTGRMPETFSNLRNVTDLRIDGSRVSGKIPDFIGNWINMGRLDLQGTSMKGPIPGTISLLTSLEHLRISDLSVSSSNFPNVRNLTKIRSLVLRNCLLTGPIPAYLSELPDLKILDLTFNRLTGTIPSTLEKLKYLQYMFLTNNSLSGEIPSWILDSDENKHLDLSYNNFTGSSIPERRCSQRENLVSSHSFSVSNKNIPWCMRKGLTCADDKPRFHSLFINCGGPGLRFENNEYEEDSSEGGAASFVSHAQQWAYSSTGVFMDRSEAPFIATNNFNLNVNEPIYENARLAPLSLKYYGLCLQPGSYKVQLHFAEIMYTDDHTFSSLGRRIFDVSIQGNVVLKDFNIMEKAGQAGHGIIQEFDNVTVYGSTLEIHLYWAGKGTRAIPDRGVYGPLISAISVTPNFEVDNGRHGGLSVGGIIGVAAASCIAVILFILIALLLKVYSKRKELQDNELGRLDLQTGHFTLRQIKHATNNFDPTYKIGEGGFGPVYRGVLSDGAVVAIKQLSSKSKQGSREFINEVGTISALRHPNLVRLYGCCVEGNQLLLIYEYLQNNSLARALFGREDQRHHLDWQARMKILLDVAKGLAYLHEESRLKIVHRDIKPSNVLLDNDLNAKISDFGLAKLDEQENTHISTRIAGTIGYMAPEYAMRGYLTDKADVYSFGIVLLEVVSGKSNTKYRPKEEFVYLLDWAYVLQEEGNLLELVDPNLGSNYSAEEARRMLTLALLCTNPSPTLRPSMSSLVSMIEGKLPIQAPRVNRGRSTSTDQDARFKALEIQSEESQDSYSYSSLQKEYASMIGSSTSLPSEDK